MGTKKKLVLPEEFSVLEANQDFEVTVEIVESDSYDARLAEFVKLTAKAVSEYVGRLDVLLEERGESSFYAEYGAVRRNLLAVQKARRASKAAESFKKAVEEVRAMTTRLQSSFAELAELGENPSLASLSSTKKKMAAFEQELVLAEQILAKLCEDNGIEADELRGQDGS